MDGSSGTRIDLGDDLIEKTAVDVPVSFSGTSVSPAVIADPTIENAQILFSEGLLEEAKKILHTILFRDSRNLLAQKLLSEIHEKELDQIFGNKTVDKVSLSASHKQQQTDDVISSLDKALGLRLSERPSLFLFEEHAEIEKFIQKTINTVSGLDQREQLDIAIAFLTMGLYEVAQKILEPIVTKDSEYRLSGAHLLVYCLIMLNKEYKAIEQCEQILSQTDVSTEQKIHFIYLEARAYEKLGKKDLAVKFYQETIRIDPDYRDAKNRI